MAAAATSVGWPMNTGVVIGVPVAKVVPTSEAKPQTMAGMVDSRPTLDACTMAALPRPTRMAAIRGLSGSEADQQERDRRDHDPGQVGGDRADPALGAATDDDERGPGDEGHPDRQRHHDGREPGVDGAEHADGDRQGFDLLHDGVPPLVAPAVMRCRRLLPRRKLDHAAGEAGLQH